MFYKSAVFLLGLLGFLKIELVGALTVTEVCLIVLVILTAVEILEMLQYRQVKLVFVTGLIYLGSQIASDLYRDTAVQDFTRGWARIGVFLMSFLFFSNAFKRYRTFIIPYLLGYAISPMASLLVYGDNVGPENIYKFHTGLMVSLLAFLVSEVRSPLLRVLRLSPIAASMVAFFENARSLAGVTLLAHIINIVAMRVRSGSHLKIKISWSRAALLALLFMVIGFSIFKSYTMAASNGWLGTEALEKYEMQATASESGEFSLFSGRQEIYFSLPKILESPLIGYGSWAKDWEYVYDMAQQRGVNAANATTGYGGMNELGLIPAHSHIFGAWLEAGLLGAIFWFSILVRTGRVLLKGSFVLTGRLSGVLAYLLLGFVWDIVFSPLGGERRVFEGFVVASLVHLEILDNVSIPRLLTSAAPAAFHRRTLMPKELSVG